MTEYRNAGARCILESLPLMNADGRGSKRRNCLMLIAVIFACFLGVSNAQSFGAIEVHVYSSEIRIREGQREWRADLSHLVLGQDCPQDEMCWAAPKRPCPGCPRDAYTVAFDERHRRLYFAISTVPSQETPWVIYSYSMTTNRITRLIDTYASGLTFGAVSPSGQYLVYEKAHHNSPAGPCGSQTDVEIIDLWQRRVGAPALVLGNSEGCVWINKLTWSSPTRLDYAGSVRQSDWAALPGGEVKGHVDVGSVVFH